MLCLNRIAGKKKRMCMNAKLDENSLKEKRRDIIKRCIDDIEDINSLAELSQIAQKVWCKEKKHHYDYEVPGG